MDYPFDFFVFVPNELCHLHCKKDNVFNRVSEIHNTMSGQAIDPPTADKPAEEPMMPSPVQQKNDQTADVDSSMSSHQRAADRVPTNRASRTQAQLGPSAAGGLGALTTFAVLMIPKLIVKVCPQCISALGPLTNCTFAY